MHLVEIKPDIILVLASIKPIFHFLTYQR
uniref:Uncharacterized protein n=1 Tax=Vitis vinifera TaxID=29760 RepID=F6HBP6_VITVI